MSKKLLFIPVLLLLHFFSIKSYAQFIAAPAKPSICTTIEAGYKKGGIIEFSPQFGCTSLGSPTAPVKINNVADPNNSNIVIDNAVLYTNVTNAFNINTATGEIPFVANELNLQMPPGHYWMLIKGDKGGQKYYGCQLYESMYAQEPKVNTTSCTGNTIALSIPADPNNRFDKYQITWAPGDVETIDVNAGQTFPINKSKTFTAIPALIQVRGSYIRNSAPTCLSEYKNISPNGGKAPFITRLEGENYGSEATINFVNFENAVSYDVLAKVDNANPSEPWNKLTVGKNGAVKITGLSPTTKYCFKLSVPGACATPIESQNTVCSIVLRSNLKSTKEVDISWNLPLLPSAVPTDLKLRETVIPCASCTPNNLSLPTKSTTTKNINTLECSKKYEYYVSTKFPAIAVVGVILPQAVEVISAPIKVDPKANATSVKPSSIAQVDYDPADENKINITVYEPGSSSSFLNNYTFFRAENDSPNYVRLGTASTNSFTDVSLIAGDAKSYCYKYQKTDECGITSELSDPFCTILLTNPRTNILNWTPYLVPPKLVTSANPSEYVVTWFDEDLGVYMPDITTNTLSATIDAILKLADKSKVKFKIRGRQFVSTTVFPSGQFINSSSNVVEIPNPARFYIPTVFTPNGNGPSESETFIINTKFITSGKLKIFDRWGGAIHEGDIGEGWDGMEKSKNSPAPVGTYPYVIDAISNEGQKIRTKGTVLLLR